MGIIKRQAVKSTVAMYLGVVIGAISMLYFFPKYLSESELGLVRTIRDVAFLILPFFIMGTTHVIRKYYAELSNKNNDGGLYVTSAICLLVCILLFSTTYYFLKDFISDFFSEKSPLFTNYLMVPLYCAIIVALYRYFESISIVNLRLTVPSILNNTLNKFVGVVLVLLFGTTIFSLTQFVYLYSLLFFAIPLFLLVIYIQVIIKPKFKFPSFSEIGSIFKRTRNYNLFLFFSGISGFIIQSIDSVMISSKMGLNFTGVYTIALYMATVIAIPKKAIDNISFPVLSKLFYEKDMEEVNRIYKKSSINQFVFGMVIFSLIWVNIDAIFELMPNGATYKEGKYVVLFLGIGKLFDLITGVNRAIIEASQYYRYNLIINVLLSLSVIGFNLLFIPIYGINGAAFASLLAMLIINSIAWYIVFYYNNLSPFSFKTIIAMVVFLTSFLILLFDVEMQSPIMSIIFNSTILALYFLISIVALNLLPEINLLLKNKFRNKH